MDPIVDSIKKQLSSFLGNSAFIRKPFLVACFNVTQMTIILL